jgi:Ca2+-dependent lipid-binding protein
MNRSSTCEDGGCNPHWNDTFYFTIMNDPMLRVEVWDDDTCEDDIVGAGSYNLGMHLNQGMDTTSIY